MGSFGTEFHSILIVTVFSYTQRSEFDSVLNACTCDLTQFAAAMPDSSEQPGRKVVWPSTHCHRSLAFSESAVPIDARIRKQVKVARYSKSRRSNRFGARHLGHVPFHRESIHKTRPTCANVHPPHIVDPLRGTDDVRVRRQQTTESTLAFRKLGAPTLPLRRPRCGLEQSRLFCGNWLHRLSCHSILDVGGSLGIGGAITD